jgi:hypothetical protein
MLGDREAVVTEVKPFDLHGVTYYEALIFSDGSTQSARLGPEGVPDGSRQGIGCWSRWPATWWSLSAAPSGGTAALPRFVRRQFE